MLSTFCVPFSGPKLRLVLFWNGRLITLPTGFCESFAKSSALISACADAEKVAPIANNPSECQRTNERGGEEMGIFHLHGFALSLAYCFAGEVAGRPLGQPACFTIESFLDFDSASSYLSPLLIRSMMFPRLKLPGFWRGGNSLNVCRNSPT